MPGPEGNYIFVSRQLRDTLATVAEQMFSETRPIFGEAANAIVVAYDDGSPDMMMIPASAVVSQTDNGDGHVRKTAVWVE